MLLYMLSNKRSVLSDICSCLATCIPFLAVNVPCLATCGPCLATCVFVQAAVPGSNLCLHRGVLLFTSHLCDDHPHPTGWVTCEWTLVHCKKKSRYMEGVRCKVICEGWHPHKWVFRLPFQCGFANNLFCCLNINVSVLNFPFCWLYGLFCFVFLFYVYSNVLINIVFCYEENTH